MAAFFIIICTLLILTWGAFVYLYKSCNKLKYELQLSLENGQNLNHKLSQLEDEIYELQTGNQAIGRKVKEISLELASLDSKQQKLSEQDPQSRFYQNGAKLIASGASLEEVMKECDLPRAEAELLFSIHQR